MHAEATGRAPMLAHDGSDACDHASKDVAVVENNLGEKTLSVCVLRRAARCAAHLRAPTQQQAQVRSREGCWLAGMM